MMMMMMMYISVTSFSSRIVAPLSCTWLSSEGVRVSSSSSAPSSLANERSSDDDSLPIFEAKQVYYHCFAQWILLHSPSSYPCCYLSQNIHVVKCCVSNFSVVKYINAKFIWIFLSHSVNRNVLVDKLCTLNEFSPHLFDNLCLPSKATIFTNTLSQGWITTPLAFMS